MNVNPALIKMEMVNLMKFYDSQYMIEKTQEEKTKSYNFTQGDYNRVTCMLYLIVRRLIKNTVLLMTQDNKIRMQPKHIMLGAAISGLIPLRTIQDQDGLVNEQQKKVIKDIIEKHQAANKTKREASPKPAKRAPAKAKVTQNRGRSGNTRKV